VDITGKEKDILRGESMEYLIDSTMGDNETSSAKKD
jgi:hypothetical protein